MVGQSIYSDEMNVDANFWRNCSREWGCGPGYRDRINEHNQKWFEEIHSGHADARVFEIVKENWDEAVVSIRQLLSQE